MGRGSASNLAPPVDDTDADAAWMVRKWGDVYPHETLISHIRRLLDQVFVCSRLSETPAQFKQRLLRVEQHLNSAAFAAPGGAGLMGLAKELRPRCEKVVELKGELGERGEALSGNKAWLRRRLHAAIVSEYLESAAGAAGE